MFFNIFFQVLTIKKGIQELVYLVFAPDRRLRKIEGRDNAQSSIISGSSDASESRLTGSLFGLGFDPVTKEPAFRGKFDILYNLNQGVCVQNMTMNMFSLSV